MNTLTERYQAMPDEQLLKTLAEREKYNEEAVTVAIAEAEARGLTIPETKVDEVPFEPIENRLKQFLQTAQIANQVGKNEDLLDSDIIREGIVPNKLALKLTLWGFGLIFTIELLVNWSHFGVLQYGFDWSTLLLFLPFLITGCVLVGLLKGFRPAFYLGAGVIVMASLGWLFDIYTLFVDRPNDPFGLIDSFYYESHTVYSFWSLLMIIKLVLLTGTGWLLCQRTVYQHFGMKPNTVPLAFLFGAMGLFLFNYLIASLLYKLF